MLYSVTGKLIAKAQNMAAVSCNGIAFHCNISAMTALLLPELGAETTLFTFLSVKQDGVELYGFHDAAEQACVRLLTGVSGVGPKVALAIMGTVKSDTLISAIATGDAKTIATAPGVGKKMAEKIIVELKSKVGGVSATLFTSDPSTNVASALPDLLMALESLGYRRLDIIEMAQKLVNENPSADVSKLVPMALKEISKGK